MFSLARAAAGLDLFSEQGVRQDSKPARGLRKVCTEFLSSAFPEMQACRGGREIGIFSPFYKSLVLRFSMPPCQWTFLYFEAPNTASFLILPPFIFPPKNCLPSPPSSFDEINYPPSGKKLPYFRPSRKEWETNLHSQISFFPPKENKDRLLKKKGQIKNCVCQMSLHKICFIQKRRLGVPGPRKLIRKTHASFL